MISNPSSRHSQLLFGVIVTYHSIDQGVSEPRRNDATISISSGKEAQENAAEICMIQTRAASSSSGFGNWNRDNVGSREGSCAGKSS